MHRVAILHAYDADGLPTAVSDGTSAVSNEWDAATGWLVRTRGAEGTEVSYAYRNDGAVTSVVSVAGAKSLGLDPYGRWKRVESAAGTASFGYADWNGLAAAVTNGATVAEYAYDRVDRVTNVAWRTVSGESLGGITYEYDVLGRITARSLALGNESFDRVYAYDGRDRLASDGGVAYRYDALGRRTATTNAEGTERHVWDGDHCLADLDECGEVIRTYLWGPGVDNLLAVRVGGRNYAALTDIQGTVWGYADECGEIVARWTYDAWGNVLSEDVVPSAEALRFVRYRFQGREFSRATGLTNFRARWYDPVTSRWLSKDPIGLSGGLNLYGFCGNSPIDKIDPDGRAHIETRPLQAESDIGQFIADIAAFINLPGNIDPRHAEIFFDDDECPPNIGYSNVGPHMDNVDTAPHYTKRGSKMYDDKKMRKAVEKLKQSGSWRGEDYNLLFHNCQDFVSAAIDEYNRMSQPNGNGMSNRNPNYSPSWSMK